MKIRSSFIVSKVEQLQEYKSSLINSKVTAKLKVC